jgi:hypothetical protein
MERVIYCPNEAFIEESSLLSKKTNLPIIIGDNDSTENLEFDRSIPQVVEIPQKYILDYMFGPINVGFHQCILYVNEFYKMRGRIELFINKESIKSSYEETHKAKYLYYCSTIGEKICQIYIDGEKIEDFSFYVN